MRFAMARSHDKIASLFRNFLSNKHLKSLFRVYEITRGKNSKELAAAHQCAIYEPELSRVWPRGGVQRQEQIEKFAKKHGWRLGHYKEDFVAIFVKEPPSKQN